MGWWYSTPGVKSHVSDSNLLTVSFLGACNSWSRSFLGFFCILVYLRLNKGALWVIY